MTAGAGKAIIAMSGGVDSSVAALLMRDAGCRCIGVTMKLYANEDIADGLWEESRSCCSLKDADDAARVCGQLGIPFYVFDFTEDFRREVIGRFVAEYAAGRTPNPCIDCNRYIKYDRLFRRMRETGFDYVVTGHYARVASPGAAGRTSGAGGRPGGSGDSGAGDRWLLLRGLDESKDQSYVLYALTQEQLAHTRFPLGELRKSEVREIATAHGFGNARKRDSQDICFVPDGDYARFIESHTGRAWPPGDFVDAVGNVLGRHEGIVRYTIGQRKGLGKAFGKPMYVKDIRPAAGEVVLGADEELYAREVRVQGINLIATARLDAPTRVTAKIRYSQKDSPAVAEQVDEDEIRLVFDEPQRAVTRGQAAVFYDGEVVVGGGTIA